MNFADYFEFSDWLIFDSPQSESHRKAYEVLRYTSSGWSYYLDDMAAKLGATFAND